MSTLEEELKSAEHGTGADGSQLSGWPLDSTEAKDFYHRIRSFPVEVSRWRKRMVSLLLSRRAELPTITDDSSEADVRDLVDEGASFLREITRLLVLIHGQDANILSELRGLTPATDDQPFELEAGAWRVLLNIGPYRELGLNASGLAPSLREELLRELVPPSLRASLNLLLERHARSICLEPAPACDSCELSKFCTKARRAEAVRQENSELPTVIDLFCGAGGSSEGFARAGFHVVASLDFNATALRTFWVNHPGVPDERVLCRDIRSVSVEQFREFLGDRELDVLIGSPPCQGFSHVGNRSKKSKTGYTLAGDERNMLFHDMVDLALALRPKLFLMENVPGMQSARSQDKSFMEMAAHRLEEEGGFRTEIWRLNASAYGVPQDRTRYFLVASSIGSLPTKPVEEYQDGAGGEFRPLFDEALPPVGVEEAIYDLPARDANSGAVVDRWDPSVTATDRRFRRFLKKAGITCQSHFLFNHWARYHNNRDLELYSLLKPGEDSVHAIEKYGRGDLMRYRKDVFDDKYSRLRGDRPSKTIVAHLAKDGNGFIHPSQVRSITPREAARLQSFPDEFVFCGSPSDQWMQIGNAVPPLLARVIARSFLKTLQREKKRWS